MPQTAEANNATLLKKVGGDTRENTCSDLKNLSSKTCNLEYLLKKTMVWKWNEDEKI